ncbi:uncharacterized protein LOC111056392 isoform X2 [Nilaparvata lugens]|uniref:uncharacterized protein LOC111056392 isoform X2 n=1 Tax=Nilaparvata lugens TaxID=108931 RepID=UPI00193E3566|nr:uncharacterized protein LOC111056392 isoform X2 [Nilaparvata lugens]XP_039298144.1 uncharacterized protein LOC111056392 isoform X2 [Nilaparvata lugens]
MKASGLTCRMLVSVWCLALLAVSAGSSESPVPETPVSTVSETSLDTSSSSASNLIVSASGQLCDEGAGSCTRAGVIKLMDGVVVRRQNVTSPEESAREARELADEKDVGLKMLRRLERFTKNHVVEIDIPMFVNSTRRSFSTEMPRLMFGKNSFLTGFGLGFLAFGLKKLLLPLFIGAQIVKSVLIAMFLPSILGGIGKLVGKGVSNFAQSSGSNPSAGVDTINDFDFKDTTNTGYDADAAGSENQPYGVWAFPPEGSTYAQGLNFIQSAIGRPTLAPYPSAGGGLNAGGAASSLYSPAAMAASKLQDRYTPKVPYAQPAATKHQGSFYSRDKQQDYKLFHQIPHSSHLLANYDPFYSPLLSRLDSVFKQLGYAHEGCRERLVCDMYNNPAKFAPYSNLVSAQLSRELNELRKPSSDNPEILRFFKYMKAAKEGQEGVDCSRRYPGCPASTIQSDAPPMLTTFNDINKLVHARKLQA